VSLNIEPVGLDRAGLDGQVTEIRLAGGRLYLRSLIPVRLDAWKFSSYGRARERHVETQDELEKAIAQLHAESVSQGQSLVVICGQQYPTRYVLPPSAVPTFRIG